MQNPKFLLRVVKFYLYKFWNRIQAVKSKKQYKNHLSEWAVLSLFLPKRGNLKINNFFLHKLWMEISYFTIRTKEGKPFVLPCWFRTSSTILFSLATFRHFHSALHTNAVQESTTNLTKFKQVKPLNFGAESNW